MALDKVEDPQTGQVDFKFGQDKVEDRLCFCPRMRGGVN